MIDEYPYSIRIEHTPKGARFTVHVYGEDKQKAMDKAAAMYLALGDELQSGAPVEKGGKSD